MSKQSAQHVARPMTARPNLTKAVEKPVTMLVTKTQPAKVPAVERPTTARPKTAALEKQIKP